MSLLVSLYMWAVWVATAVFTIPVLMVFITVLGRERGFPIVRGWSRVWLRLSGIRVKVRGLEKVDLSKSYIAMGNHINLLDPFVLSAVTPVSVIGLEKKENFRIPFYGWLMTAWGNVGIDRKNLEQAKFDLKRAGDMLRKEHAWLMALPEGTRSRDGRLQPFKKGCFHLALDTGIPILPWTMNGAYEIQARGQFWARMGTVEIVFGEPIDPADYGPERLDDLMAAVRKAMLEPYTGLRMPEDQIQPTPALALDMVVKS